MRDDDWLRVLGAAYVLNVGPLGAILFVASIVAPFWLRRRHPLFGWVAAATALAGAATLVVWIAQPPAWVVAASRISMALMAAAFLLTGLAAFRLRRGSAAGVVALVAAGVLVGRALYFLTPWGSGSLWEAAVVVGVVASVVLGVSLFLLGSAWRSAGASPDAAPAA